MSLFSLLFCLILSTTSGVATAQETPPSGIEVEIRDLPVDLSKLSPAEQKKAIARLVKDAEEASEGGGEHGSESGNKVGAFFKEYAKKLNIPKVALGMYRWYNVMSDKYPAMVADLSIMLMMSHTLEMLSGPVGVSLSTAAGAPQWVNWTIGVAGGVISIPGLDPLCIGLGIAYVKSPHFRSGVTYTRVAIMKVVSALGVDRFLNWFIQKTERVDFIKNSLRSEPGRYRYLTVPSDDTSGLKYEFRNTKNEVFARVEFELNVERGTVHAKKATFFTEPSTSVSPKQFSQMLGLFNHNVSDAFSKSYSSFKKGNIESAASEYHVTVVDQHAGGIDFTYLPKALKLTEKRSWSQNFWNAVHCPSLFGN
jgi:hypothetical protein